MQELPNETIERLREIVEAGGTIEINEGSCDDLHYQGLVDVKSLPGAWRYAEEVSLSNRGRRALGLPVVTPEVPVSLFARLVSWVRGRTSPTV